MFLIWKNMSRPKTDVNVFDLEEDGLKIDVNVFDLEEDDVTENRRQCF